jgi:hypothetical protein
MYLLKNKFKISPIFFKITHVGFCPAPVFKSVLCTVTNL